MTDDHNNTPTKLINYDRLAKCIVDPHRASAEVFVKISGFKNECAPGVSKELERSAQRVANGDLSGLEEALISQTHLLNGIVVDASKKYMTAHFYQAAQAYGGLVFKAHAAFRQTFQTLSEMKNPKAAPTTAVQVNVHASGEKSANELLTAGQNATLDA
jgi:hypothetical protein